ncbi:MAG: hypothetical protein ABIR66_09590 [Saprospiraceae bacterium]
MILSTINAPHYTWGDERKNCDGWHLCKTVTLSMIEENMPPETKKKYTIMNDVSRCFIFYPVGLIIK